MGTEVVLLKLVPPSRPNGVIIEYKVDVYLGNPETGAGKLKTDYFPEGNIRKIYVGKLLERKMHWFKVAAKTIVGYGPYSSVVSTKTLHYDRKLKQITAQYLYSPVIVVNLITTKIIFKIKII